MKLWLKWKHWLLDFVHGSTPDRRKHHLPTSFVSHEKTDVRACVCCDTPLTTRKAQRVLACRHVYCRYCIQVRCRMGVSDRSMVPVHCCNIEFPTEYVQEALGPSQFAQYQRFVKERHWTSSTLQSDQDYQQLVQQLGGMQCPQCGIGVIRISGCTSMRCPHGHHFQYTT